MLLYFVNIGSGAGLAGLFVLVVFGLVQNLTGIAVQLLCAGSPELRKEREMSKELYKVTAKCRNSLTCGQVFIVTRKQVVKKNTAGQEYIIQGVVCPLCRMWADITKIEKA